MQPLNKFFLALVALYVTVMFVGLSMLGKNDGVSTPNSQAHTQLPEIKKETKKLEDEIKQLRRMISDLQNERHNDEVKVGHAETTPIDSTPAVVKRGKGGKKSKKVTKTNEFAKFFGGRSPFGILGAYPDVSHVFTKKPSYDTPHLGIINEDDYCDRADLYNLNHPKVLFEQRNFFSDYPGYTLPRKQVMKPTGTLVMDHIATTMPVEDFESRKYKLKLNINNYFNNFRGAMDYFHEVGKHFACATQMYNHIPGHGNLIQKDSLLDSFRPYVAKYNNIPQCFNETSYFLSYFRLYDREECKSFFEMVHSQKYKDSLKEKPIQYLVKIGRGSHKGQGVFILDNEKIKELDVEYGKGLQCGELKKSLIVQGYVHNPLLLNLGNKFDFRLYGLIASTNPLIAYYHDGFLRVALSKFDANSSDKSKHLTNTALATKVIDEAFAKGEKIMGMTKAELEEYHLWSLEKLQEYLLSVGRITDKNWLNNYLRPQIHRAIIHIIKMTSDNFLKHSNLYELHGLDFILDNDMKVWFVESNPSPLLTGTTKHMVYYEVIKDSFEIMYSYYRSRMLRFARLINAMMQDSKALGANLPQWKLKFQEAAKNRLEKEFPIPKTNTFTLIMDEGLEGEKAYTGLIKKECVLKK